jgi:membrane-associated protease RseP (regulator of RpoE activity)
MAAAAAVVVLVAVWGVPHTQTPSMATAVQAAWVPLDSPADDAGLALVSEVMPAVEEDGQSWTECSGCLEGLSDAERRVVIETLRQEIGRKS